MQGMVVSVDRWSLYRGALVSLRWPMHGAAYSGHYRQVFFLYRLVVLTARFHCIYTLIAINIIYNYTACIYIVLLYYIAI